jgi:hypothetical protein
MPRIAITQVAGSGTAQIPRSAFGTNPAFTIFDPALTMNSESPKGDDGARGSYPRVGFVLLVCSEFQL